MRLTAPTCIIAALVCAVAAVLAPVASGSFGVTEEHFEAGTCKEASCTYASPHSVFYTQAAGHPPFGITAFEFNSEPKTLGSEPVGNVKNIRVDVPPGLAANPEALPKCSIAAFEKDECGAPTEVGTDELVVFTPPVGPNVPITGTVYNLEQPEGIPLEFGIHVSLAGVINEHIFLVGHLSWSTDYHEYFEINNVSKTIPILKSKLIFTGTAGTGFLTLPSECSSSTTSHLRVESYTGEVSETYTHTPVGVDGCGSVPFKPSVGVTPGDSQSDRPDGALVKVTVPQSAASTEINSSDLRNAVVTLPEGMTLNPPAANGLTGCSNAQIAIKTANPVTCPPASKIGTVEIETPDLPAGSLAGNVYLGQPLSSEPASGEEYRIFIDAESVHGVSVRLEGHVAANPGTGRLTTTFTDNPQLPFRELILAFEGGEKAPLANPLMCGLATTNASFTPYRGTPAAEPFASFPIDFDGKGAACPSPLPFVLGQSAATTPTTGGAAATSFNFSLTRGEGQQYVSKLTTVLPPGLVGKIPLVTLCGEPQAQRGECNAASQIGTVSASLGSGSPLLTLPGTAYLTGPYGNAPYGLSVVVPAEKVGPFDYGKIVTRAAISVEPFTSRIVVSSQLPTIVGGVPLRLRSLDVNVNRPNFVINPTNCAALKTETTLTSTFGTNQTLSTPFQATACSALAFAPKLTASTNAKTSRANGAILVVKVAYPAGPQANIKSVLVTLPKLLSSRDSTLNNACPEATFNASPLSCPPLSKVGSATVATPVLPDKLIGTAIFVSHGGAAFPDLDLVLQGDGVTVILVGNTNISKGVTTSNYASIPDVPVSSFEVRLPTGKDSVLSAIGNLCKSSLIMPTTITAQNGKVIKQNTKVAVGDCPITVLSHRIRGHKAIIRAKVFSAGRVTASGKDLSTRLKRPGKAKTVTVEVPLSRAGLRALARHRHGLNLHVRLGFAPKSTKIPKSSASVTLLFK